MQLCSSCCNLHCLLSRQDPAKPKLPVPASTTPNRSLKPYSPYPNCTTYSCCTTTPWLHHPSALMRSCRCNVKKNQDKPAYGSAGSYQHQGFQPSPTPQQPHGSTSAHIKGHHVAPCRVPRSLQPTRRCIVGACFCPRVRQVARPF